MKAIVPHKDTTLLLAQLQRQIITELNTKYPEAGIYPVYPLWCFDFDSEGFKNLQVERLTRCFIQSYFIDVSDIYFVLTLVTDKSTYKGRIKFASSFKATSIHSIIKEEPVEKQLEKEIKLHVFKTGDVEIKNKAWYLYNETWHKTTE